MDGHDLIVDDIKFLQRQDKIRQDKITILDLEDPGVAQLAITARANAAEAERLAGEAAQACDTSPQRTRLAEEVWGIKRRNAAQAASIAARGVVDPRRSGTTHAVARSWVLGTAW